MASCQTTVLLVKVEELYHPLPLPTFLFLSLCLSLSLSLCLSVSVSLLSPSSISGPVECARELVEDRSLLTLTFALQCFPSSPSLLLSAMALLGVGLARCPPEARLHLLSDHGQLLDIVLLGMSAYPNHTQLQSYASAFIALLIAEGKGRAGRSVCHMLCMRV